MKKFCKRQMVRVWAPATTLAFLGGCGLSDQQLTSIAQSVITTALNAFVSQGASLIFQSLGNGAAG